ncbi:MAG: hypothetical protein MAG715_01264 [Methanonatronarchaeales archaeon]|nr:hypothetical protein [Methanonatronarchaeales archaeon]
MTNLHRRSDITDPTGSMETDADLAVFQSEGIVLCYGVDFIFGFTWPEVVENSPAPVHDFDL